MRDMRVFAVCSLTYELHMKAARQHRESSTTPRHTQVREKRRPSKQVLWEKEINKIAQQRQ